MGYTTAMVGKWYLGEQTASRRWIGGFGEFFGFLGGGHSRLLPGRLAGKGYDESILRNREPVAETTYLTGAFSGGGGRGNGDGRDGWRQPQALSRR